MLRLLIPVILLLLGLGGGVGAGVMLRPEPAPEETAEAQAQDAPEGETETDAPPDASPTQTQTPQAAPSQSAPVMPGSAENLEYVRLNNQFIVPVVKSGRVHSLVVLSLVLEVVAGQNQLVFDREPRLRDALLQVMFAHANAGGFDDVFTSALAMTPLRQGLREAAANVVGPIINDVLIVDIMRQDP